MSRTSKESVIEELVGEIMSSLEDCCNLAVVSHWCEKLVAEAGECLP
jgi:hypothetical protein